MKPLLSIISITLNDREGITRTLESVNEQMGAPFIEHIIIDGLSNYDIGKALRDMNSTAVLHQAKDQGLYDAMNRGTDLACGEYLLYLNGGDVLASPYTLHAVASVLRRERPDFLYGDSYERQLDGNVVFKGARSHETAPVGMFTHHQSMIFKASLIDGSSIRYDLSFPIAADYDFVLRFLDKSRKVVRYDGVIAHFSAGGVSQMKHHSGRKEQFVVRKRHFRSFFFAACVYVLQVVLMAIRNLSPKIYWAMRNAFGKAAR